MSEPNSFHWRRFLEPVGLTISWLWLAAIGVLAAFQFHATLIFLGLQLVTLTAANRLGWNTSTIYGLGRFLYLVLGIIWLLSVMFLDRYLREAQRQGTLINRTARLSAITGLLYGFSYLLLLLMS